MPDLDGVESAKFQAVLLTPAQQTGWIPGLFLRQFRPNEQVQAWA